VQICAGYAVSFWKKIPQQDSNFQDYYSFGKIIRKFHEIAQELDLVFPDYDVTEKIRSRIEGLRLRNMLDEDEYKLLQQKERDVSLDISNFATRLGSGVIHGDAHSGNLIKTPYGIVLCDYENVSNGYREWDLVPTLVTERRFRLRDRAFEDFMSGYYGAPATSDGIEPLCQARELSMVSWLLQNRLVSRKHDREAAHRLSTLAHNSLEKWNPF
jgi:thiamine kinase-like enzyme